MYNKDVMDKKPRNITEYSMMKQEETTTINVSEPTNIPDIPKMTVSDEEQQIPIELTRNDYKSLKHTKYFELKDKYKTAYLLKNKKTGAVAAIQALSSVHACSFIGWRPKNVTVIDALRT